MATGRATASRERAVWSSADPARACSSSATVTRSASSPRSPSSRGGTTSRWRSLPIQDVPGCAASWRLRPDRRRTSRRRAAPGRKTGTAGSCRNSTPTSSCSSTARSTIRGATSRWRRTARRSAPVPGTTEMPCAAPRATRSISSRHTGARSSSSSRCRSHPMSSTRRTACRTPSSSMTVATWRQRRLRSRSTTARSRTASTCSRWISTGSCARTSPSATRSSTGSS